MTNPQHKNFSNPFNNESFDQPEFEGQEKVYIVCSAPRSGSNLLCDLLRQNGVGVPHEYFHVGVHIPILARRFNLINDENGLNFTQYIETLIRHRTTSNGWFALKIQFEHLSWLEKYTSLIDLFPEAKFIYLRRNDQISQAVSLSLAQQTQQWHGEHVSINTPKYNFQNIARNVSLFNEENSNWDKWMEAHGIVSCNVSYEDLLDKPVRTAGKLSDFLVLDHPLQFDIGKSIFERQSNDVNRQWIEQFTLDSKGHLNAE